MKKIILLLLLFVGTSNYAQYVGQQFAININNTSASITWAINTQGNPSNARLRMAVAPAPASSGTIVANYGFNPIIPGSGFAIQDFNLTGLTPNTTYNFNVELTNPATGTIYPHPGVAGVAGPGSFTTTGPPSAPSISNNTVATTTTSATISFNINANNAATTPIIRYGTSPGSLTSNQSGTVVTGNTSVSQSITLSSLTLNTIYYYIIEATNTSGTTNFPSTGTFQFTTNGTAPTITNVTAVNITSSSADITFTINPNGFTTTTLRVQYGPVVTNINIPLTNVSGSSNINLSVPLTGLIAGQNYRYIVYAENSQGDTTFPLPAANFTTTPPPANSMLYHFPFNGSLSSADNTVSLTNNGSAIVYTNGNTAISGTGRTLNAALQNLPTANAARTVFLRVLFNNATQLAQSSPLFNWGTATANQAYGATFNGNGASENFSNFVWGSNDYNFNSSAITAGVWQTFTFTFNGTSIVVYQNGVAIPFATANRTLNTTGQNLYIGNILSTNPSGFNCDIDDLRIFNYALSATEIAALHSLLSTTDFETNNLKFSMYPNPANSILNIELASEIKNVEIYSLQGQKVLSATEKQINISGLSSGIYMVKVVDENGAVATQKLVKN